jgi:hypothetical protein
VAPPDAVWYDYPDMRQWLTAGRTG